MKQHALRIGAYVLLPLLMLSAWWLATVNGGSLYFPPPATVLEHFQENWLFGLVGTHVVPSLMRMISGLVVGVFLGIVMGLIVGRINILHRATKPWFALLRSMPGPTIVVMFLVLFGTGSLGKVYMIAFVSLFPVLMNTIDGVRATEPVLLDVARSYRLSYAEQIFKVVLPAAMPQIAVGIRTSVSLAFIVMIVSEYFGGTNGIGYFTRDSASAFAIPDMWSGMLLLGILGIAINILVAASQRRALRWYVGAKKTASKS